MTETEIAEMVADLYWSRLPDGSMPLPDETAVRLVVEYTGVTRQKAMGLLLENSPSRRAQRRGDGTWR